MRQPGALEAVHQTRAQGLGQVVIGKGQAVVYKKFQPGVDRGGQAKFGHGGITHEISPIDGKRR